jgi:HEAT repeat protein
MKMLSRWTSFALATVTTALLLVGCEQQGGMEQKADKNIDVNAAIVGLKSGDKEKMISACTELGQAREYAAPAVDDLIAALKNDDPLVRRLAAYALGQIGPKAIKAVPALKQTMESDSDITVMPACVNALRAIDPKSAPKQTLTDTP